MRILNAQLWGTDVRIHNNRLAYLIVLIIKEVISELVRILRSHGFPENDEDDSTSSQSASASTLPYSQSARHATMYVNIF